MDAGCKLGGIPEETKKIHRLRREIDRIKGEINTLLRAEGVPPSQVSDQVSNAESLQAITCVGCRHDEITRFMEEDLDLNPFLCGISVRGGLIRNKDRTRAWWTTTLRITSVGDLARYVRTVENIYNYLRQISDIRLLSELQHLATGQDSPTSADVRRKCSQAVQKGINLGLIRAKNSAHSLTPKGWELYVTLVHLVHNHVIKLDPERSKLISDALAEKLGWIHGTFDDVKPYQMSMTEKMDLIRRSGILSDLIARGLTQNQVQKFLYDNWHMNEQTNLDTMQGRPK